MKRKKRSLGHVDAFGLDSFGAPAGLNPLWGAVTGAGLGTITAIGLRQWGGGGKMSQNAEAIGGLVAGLASGAMIAFKGTRAAGWTGLAATFLNNGLRSVEQYMMTPKLPTLPTSGVVIDPTTAFQGLGIVDITDTTAFQGLGAGRGDMPQLVGASLAQASQHVQLVGGPALSGDAGRWGATHFNH